MTKNRSLSIANKVALFFLLVVGFVGGGLWMALKEIHERDLLANAKQLAEMSTAVLKATEEMQGLWTTKRSKVPVVAEVSGLLEESGDEIQLFRIHDPDFHRFVAELARPTGAELKITFGDQALPRERWSFEKGVFFYERPVVATKACMSCHERYEDAPSLKVGEVAGMIQIRFPQQGLYARLGNNFSLWLAVAFFLVTVVLYALVRFELINPILDLTRKVQEMSLGNLDVNFGVQNLNEKDAKDELVKLAIAMERLRKSQKVMEKMLDDDSLVL